VDEKTSRGKKRLRMTKRDKMTQKVDQERSVKSMREQQQAGVTSYRDHYYHCYSSHIHNISLNQGYIFKERTENT
jgi:hypothetical protein